MTARLYLRRAPKSASVRRRTLYRVVAALVALLVFAVMDTTGSVHVTRLTRNIQDHRVSVLELQSELAYLIDRHGELSLGGGSPGYPEFRGEFAPPDSGRIRAVVTGENGTRAGGAIRASHR